MFPGDGSGKFQDNVSDLAAISFADILSGFSGTTKDKNKGMTKMLLSNNFSTLTCKKVWQYPIYIWILIARTISQKIQLNKIMKNEKKNKTWIVKVCH